MELMHCQVSSAGVNLLGVPRNLQACFQSSPYDISTLAGSRRINVGFPTSGKVFDRFGGVNSLAEVRLQEGETLENALRRFKRKVQQEDIIKEVKRHSFYLKPGEKLRVKQALARKRNRKKSRREVE